MSDRKETIGIICGVISMTLLALLVGGFLWYLFTGWMQVPDGHVGVLTGGNGERVEYPLKPGVHFVPFGTVELISTKPRLRSVTRAVESSGHQPVSLEAAVRYSLNNEMAPRLFRAVGDGEAIDARVVKPAIESSLKAITAVYTWKELVAQPELAKRELSEAVRLAIDKTLNADGMLGAVEVADVTVVTIR